jgi:Leucine-rich repeat (LRR) protein
VLLGFNRLQALPADIASAAPELSVLDVRDNQITHLDMAALLPLRKLKTLDLRNNEVGKLPPLLGVMTSITALLLEGNPLKTMRRTMIDASAREILDYLRGRMGDEDFAALAAAGSKAGGGARAGGRALEGGLADEVTDAVRGAMSLDARLDLRHKGLHVIPEETASLTSLRSADFSDNKISSLPHFAPHVWGGTLRELNLSRNLLGRALGRDCAGGGGGGLDVLGGLRSLTALTMQRNELAVVPEAITALENLEVLDLSQNLVTSLDNLRVSPAIVIVIFQFRYVNVLFALYNVYNSCIV